MNLYVFLVRKEEKYESLYIDVFFVRKEENYESLCFPCKKRRKL
jgi:hypothetical protein